MMVILKVNNYLLVSSVDLLFRDPQIHTTMSPRCLSVSISELLIDIFYSYSECTVYNSTFNTMDSETNKEKENK